MLTSTVAVPPAGTVSVGVLKVTVAKPVKKDGLKVLPPVARAPV